MCVISNDDCISSFKFFGIVKQSGLDSYDGILGLSPDNGNNGPSYVSNLKNFGIIDTSKIGFFISKGLQDSVMTFGGWDD